MFIFLTWNMQIFSTPMSKTIWESLAGPRVDVLAWAGAQEYPKPLLWPRLGQCQPQSQRG